MLVHFTIPIRFGHLATPDAEREEHPVVPEATADDWFDVEVPAFTQNYGVAENEARVFVNEHYGNTGWMSTYPDGPKWDAIKERYAPGSCVATLVVPL